MTDNGQAAPENGQRESENGQDGKQKEGPASRERSTIQFPYMNLETVLPLPKAIHAIGGHDCERGQLAAQMGLTVNGGQFRTKLQNARNFGLLKYSGESVELTDIGIALCDPDTEKEALVQAFLSVSLFSQLYETFRDHKLPPDAAIQRRMIEEGVAYKQAQRARQVFKSSAATAGFFAIARDKLVRPHTSSSSGRFSKEASPPQEGNHSGGGDEPPGGSRHPLMQALLAEMPESGTRWERDHCVMWLNMMLLSFGMMYENRDELRPIEIKVNSETGPG